MATIAHTNPTILEEEAQEEAHQEEGADHGETSAKFTHDSNQPSAGLQMDAYIAYGLMEAFEPV